MVKSVSHEKYHSAVWRPGSSIFCCSFHCPTVLFERLSSVLLSLCQRWGAGVTPRSSGPGSEKSMVTHPFPACNAPNPASARRGDRQTRAASWLLRSPNSPVLVEKVPSEILLSQNFNGLAKNGFASHLVDPLLARSKKDVGRVEYWRCLTL